MDLRDSTLVLAILAFMLSANEAQATHAKIGDSLPIEIFCEAESVSNWEDSLKIVLLSPRNSEYSGMLRRAFDEYFRAGHVFAKNGQPRPSIKVVHITGPETTITSTDAGTDVRMMSFLVPLGSAMDSDCRAVSSPDAMSVITQATGVALPKVDNSDAVVLLLDKQNVIRWRDDAYRAQGEHLKPLEAAVKSLLGVRSATISVVHHQTQLEPLKLGDVAPDFVFNFAASSDAGMSYKTSTPESNARLSDYRGKVVLLTFYPAAFSGTLPTVEGSVTRKIEEDMRARHIAMMSCSVQLRQMDRIKLPKSSKKQDVVKLTISASTPELLQSWARLLDTHDMHYLNDPDYAIAKRYGSYDARVGYNLRKVFVIDRDGKIVFIDDDYAEGDADELQVVLQRALGKNRIGKAD